MCRGSQRCPVHTSQGFSGIVCMQKIRQVKHLLADTHTKPLQPAVQIVREYNCSFVDLARDLCKFYSVNAFPFLGFILCVMMKVCYVSCTSDNFIFFFQKSACNCRNCRWCEIRREDLMCDTCSGYRHPADKPYCSHVKRALTGQYICFSSLIRNYANFTHTKQLLLPVLGERQYFIGRCT